MPICIYDKISDHFFLYTYNLWTTRDVCDAETEWEKYIRIYINIMIHPSFITIWTLLIHFMNWSILCQYFARHCGYKATAATRLPLLPALTYILRARAHTHTSLSLIHVQLLPAHERICLYHMYVCTNWLLSFCRYRLLSTYLYMCYSNTFDMHVTVKAKHSKETHTSGLALLANGRASGTTYLHTALLHLQAATIRCSVTFVCSCHLSTPNTKW